MNERILYPQTCLVLVFFSHFTDDTSRFGSKKYSPRQQPECQDFRLLFGTRGKYLCANVKGM